MAVYVLQKHLLHFLFRKSAIIVKHAYFTFTCIFVYVIGFRSFQKTFFKYFQWVVHSICIGLRQMYCRIWKICLHMFKKRVMMSFYIEQNLLWINPNERRLFKDIVITAFPIDGSFAWCCAFRQESTAKAQYMYLWLSVTHRCTRYIYC